MKKSLTMKQRRILSAVFWGIILTVMFLICVYPIIWMFLGSLKTSGEFYTNIWGLPDTAQFVNYLNAWNEGQLGQKFINSLIVTGGSLLILIPVNCCAAYAIARLRFRHRTAIYFLLLLGIMIPSGVLGIPTFTVAMKLGLLNSHFGLMLIYAAQSISMGIFIMRSFFISLPKELEEAAMIDGCSRFGGFVRVILPLTKPGIMTQVIFNGLTIWNEYFMANIILTKPELKTLPLALANFTGKHSTDYPTLFAALAIATIPVVVTFILAQKSFIQGISAGSVKG
ncbi:MAG: carbohydrate ABC transporter permease [Oscillospiraceae bacterium]|nr:carbohydrate ABC transporter permease [Oscillospiraceae bacterium]